MDEPIKIIYKYKNEHRRTQYNMYIFIGDVPNNIMKVLKKIQDLQLYDSLMALSNDEIDTLNKFYGYKWYTKFFNTYHINATFEYIKKNNKIQVEIIKKLGKDWYNLHIVSFDLMEKKLLYNYNTLIRDEILRKEHKKHKTIWKDENELDYTTLRRNQQEDTRLKGGYNNKNGIGSKNDVIDSNDYREIQRVLNKIAEYDYNTLHDDILVDGKRLKSYNDGDLVEFDNSPIRMPNKGYDVNVEEDEFSVEFETLDVEDDIKKPDKEIDEEMGELEVEEFDDIVSEEMNIDEAEQIYQDNDILKDDNITKTSDLIKQALNDDRLFNKLENKLVDFDTSKDNLTYDDTLRNVYYKHYVTSFYIYKDDTIKTIKNKICISIKNNPKFGGDGIIAPSRQYLWSEYFFDNKLEKIMIGQKWIKRSEMLTIDIEPNNNLRVYEELRNNLKFLRDNIRRYGSKIKREDDDFNILYDYEKYFSNNELYMIDIYNELGRNYNPDQETLKNVIDVYVRVYFPRIKTDDVKYIIEYLNGDIKTENTKSKNIYETLTNDLIIEHEIMKSVENAKKTQSYKSLFKENYIIQSVIHVNLRKTTDNKIDLFRIFNEFTVNSQYPFIQYQTLDGQLIFKYSEKDITYFGTTKDNISVLSKWFENAPYGISFKVRISERQIEKYMAINLGENGRIEYKTQWKEDDMATIVDIKNTYSYVRDLIDRINKDNNKVTFAYPVDEEFRYAFINTMQKFELPEKFIINHNDLSEFSRYFYPYIALVVEPRKRLSKKQGNIEKGKYGTYLRYKRVSKYENQSKIEQRVLYLMRNYDHSDQGLANEISKQFNITIDRATEEIERVKNKYHNIKKSRKILKRLDTIPKYKPPGIGIDIQGKQRDQYKIRVSGARNKEQLDRIITFYNILIHLYVETYLYKKPERQNLKEKLKKLTNIAKRRNKVDEIVNYEKDGNVVKKMEKIDKKRLGFKPDKGQNQWTRSCQNSGNDKKRRPQQFMSVDNLLKQGFKFDKETGTYVKKTKVKGKKGQVKEILIRAIGLDNIDDEGNNVGSIYYTCNPNVNVDHMHIGFLSRSNNPYGQCMPCCFKKDQYNSNNKEIQNYYIKCINQEKGLKKNVTKLAGEKLYILQDTNKIQEGRVGFLPRYLDYFLNQMMGKTRKIRNHYLLASDHGYHFKYGTSQINHQFLSSICSALDLNIDTVIETLIKKIEDDKSDVLFTALNNGDIRTSFETREKYINFLKNNSNISFDLVSHLILIPGIIVPNGLNIIVFKKETIVIKSELEKEKIRDDFIIQCQNMEELYNIKNKDRDTIILVRENKNYYPIIFVLKKEAEPEFIMKKTFKYENKKDNIINHIYDFYVRNCRANIIGQEINKVIAKELYRQLIELNNAEYMPHSQIIDTRNKCKYIITKNSAILPIKPSGTIYNLNIIKNIESKYQTVNETIAKLDKLSQVSNGNIKVKPIGIYYDAKTKDNVTVIGIMTELYEFAPVKPETMNIVDITNKGLVMEYKQLFDKVDIAIAKGKGNHKIDERITAVQHKQYENEAYQLFRLHLSEYINKPVNEHLKKKITRIINNANDSKSVKYNKLRFILFKIIDKNLKIIFDNTLNEPSNNVQSGGKFMHVLSKMPDLSNYAINNNREICNVYTDKNKCNTNAHCYWSHDECHFSLTRDLIITFVNKVCEEFAINEHKAAELLQTEGYYVSDIVDYGNYEERVGQKIIKSTNNTINNVLAEIFGKENIPKIGKKKFMRTNANDSYEVQVNNPMKNLNEYILQQIIEGNITIFRAYANAYTWLKHTYYELETRNMGYYSNLQTDMANYFRSNVIDWLVDKKNNNKIVDELANYMNITKRNFITDYINKIGKDTVTVTTGIVEYYVLNQIYSVPIIIYDEHNTILYIIDNGVKYDKFNMTVDINNSEFEKYKKIDELKNFINIRFITLSTSNIPLSIEVAYYK